MERQFLESCEEDLLNLYEEENSENKEEDISLEQRYFVNGWPASFTPFVFQCLVMTKKKAFII